MQAIHQDIQRYGGSRSNLFLVSIVAAYTNPSFVGVVWYRIGRAFWLKRKNPVFLFLLVVNRLLYPLIRMYSGLELSPRADIGPGLCVTHFGPTVIHANTVAGDYLTVLQGVTIGAGHLGVPRLGNHVSIGTGATIIGGITVGNNVTIGAGAVVTKDIPDGTTVVGIPARPINNAAEPEDATGVDSAAQ